MNILITGSTGYIGTNLCKALLQEGHQLFFTTRKLNAEIGSDTAKQFINIEDTPIENIRDYLNGHHIEAIIHLASLFLVKHQGNDISPLINSNVTFGTKLIDAAVDTSVKYFINTGTFWQHYENSAYNPVNLYAATKEAFLSILKFYHETTQIKFLTLELSDTFGPNDTRGKIVNRWLSMARQYYINSQDIVPPMAMSPGLQEINIQYIDDVVQGFLTALNFLKHSEKNFYEFSLTSFETLSLKEMASIFSHVFGFELPINFGALPYRDREVMKVYTRGLPLPGFQQRYSFQEGLLAIKSLGF